MPASYLKQDYIGACSGIVYGRMGDSVEIIDMSRPMYLVENKGQRFFVYPDKLSTELQESENVSREMAKEIPAEVIEVQAKPITFLPKEEPDSGVVDLFGAPVSNPKKKSKKK